MRSFWPLACLRLFALDEQPFWLDEAHTADFTTLTVGELWSFDSPYDTVNTPGYILVMKLWSQVSRSDWWFRALSALAGIATVPVVYLVGARVSSRRAGYVAAVLLPSPASTSDTARKPELILS